MADINLLDGSTVSNDLLLELLNRLGDVTPGPYADDAAAVTDGVPEHGIYDQLGTLARVQP